MNRPVPPLEYLLDCSEMSLKEFWNAHLNDAANRRKELHRLLPEYVEAAAMALLAEWFALNGEAFIAAAGADPEDRKKLLEELRIRGSHKLAEAVGDPDAQGLALFGAPRRR